MFKTNQGVIENEQSIIYLRPKTAQGILLTLKYFTDNKKKTSIWYLSNWKIISQ